MPNFPHMDDKAPDTEKRESTKISSSMSRKKDIELVICVEEAVSLNVAVSHTECTKWDVDTALLPNMPHEPAKIDHCVAPEEKKACEKDPDSVGPSNAPELHHCGGEHDHSSNSDK